MCEILGSAGLRTQKIPKNESEDGQDDDKHCPENFLPGIRAALKDVYDRPNVGDENDKTAQTLVLHISIILIGIGKTLRYTLGDLSRNIIIRPGELRR
jgi:hypothetical protein